jgi:hypothetical protein
MHNQSVIFIAVTQGANPTRGYSSDWNFKWTVVCAGNFSDIVRPQMCLTTLTLT